MRCCTMVECKLSAEVTRKTRGKVDDLEASGSLLRKSGNKTTVWRRRDSTFGVSGCLIRPLFDEGLSGSYTLLQPEWVPEGIWE